MYYLSDLLDGHLARRNSQVSEFGKIIDPLQIRSR
ncbi:MAG: CDP-alcohol phosphatidyltransferase family protein [Ignavibacteria bacterium]|nr:CDP-alcohol phosphatidyltransferase family protein [Ignavibacteria bacterium]